jgi:RecA/RadA recombinase
VTQSLQIESQLLIERKRERIGRVIVIRTRYAAIIDVEFLDSGAELLPRAVSARRHPE